MYGRIGGEKNKKTKTDYREKSNKRASPAVADQTGLLQRLAERGKTKAVICRIKWPNPATWAGDTLELGPGEAGRRFNKEAICCNFPGSGNGGSIGSL